MKKMCALVVVNLATVASGQLNETFKLTASDAAEGDQFGFSVAVDGGIVAVGATLDDDNGDRSGSAYLFDAVTGAELFKLLPSDGSQLSFFGTSIAVEEGVVAVGKNQFGTGAVYLFDTSTGMELFKLLPADGAGNHAFADSLALDSGVVAVGAPGDNENGTNSGSAYLFDASTGAELFKLLPSDGNAEDRFGWSIAIDSGVVVVGAVFEDLSGDYGSVYLFDASTGAEMFQLVPNDGASNHGFGDSVAIDDGVVAVGASNDDSHGGFGSGSAYLFDASTGAQLFKLTASDASSFDRFGSTIAVNDGVVAVGSPGDDDAGSGSGSVYLFDASTGTEIAKLLASDGAAGDGLSRSLGISNGRIVVGAYQDDDNGDRSGAAYVFDLNPSPCPGDIADDFGTIGGDGMVSFGDFLALLGLVGPCGGGTGNPDCIGDIADDFGVLGGDGMVSFGDFLALLGLVGPCP